MLCALFAIPILKLTWLQTGIQACDRVIELCKPMVDHANLIIQKCDGNLRAINIISGLLGTKTRTSTEWEKLLNRFDSELKNKPDPKVRFVL